MCQYFLLVLLCSGLIAACQPAQLPLPASTTVGIATPQIAATATLASTVSKTSTATVELPTATPDIIGTVVAKSKPRVHSSQVSPDRNWRAEVVIYDCVQVGEEHENAYEQLRLLRSSDGTEQLVDTQLQYCGGLGGFGFKEMFWSPNSRYFYYTNAREGTPDGLCGYWEPPIVSFDTLTGNAEYLGYGPVSPDGTKIAAWGDRELVLWDVDSGEIGRITVADMGNVAGPIAWSPNSQALVYVRSSDYCPPRGKSVVARIDLPELRQVLLLESAALSFETILWDKPDRLELFDEEQKAWRYEFASKELTPSP